MFFIDNTDVTVDRWRDVTYRRVVVEIPSTQGSL